MGQVSEEISLDPPSGRPGYNLDDYIRKRERSLRSEGEAFFSEKRKK